MESDNPPKADLDVGDGHESDEIRSSTRPERDAAQAASAQGQHQRIRARPAFVEEADDDLSSSAGNSNVSREDFATWPERERVRIADSEADEVSERSSKEARCERRLFPPLGFLAAADRKNSPTTILMDRPPCCAVVTAGEGGEVSWKTP